jgi:rubrerythrin
MGATKTQCEHRCRNTCAMLDEALQNEQKQIAFFESMLADCDDPVVKKFAKEVVDSHTLLANRIKEQLDTIKANAEVLDGVMTSFEG